MARPRGRSPGFQRKIDFKQWNAAPGLTAEVRTTTLTVGGLLSFSSPATILRWRSYWSGILDETRQIGDEMLLIYAIGVFSTDAVVAGALPDPIQEPEYPWVFWDEMVLNSFSISDARAPWGPGAQRREVDSKALRKVKPGESLVYVVQSADVSGAPVTLIDVGQLRVLIGT